MLTKCYRAVSVWVYNCCAFIKSPPLGPLERSSKAQKSPRRDVCVLIDQGKTRHLSLSLSLCLHQTEATYDCHRFLSNSQSCQRRALKAEKILKSIPKPHTLGFSISLKVCPSVNLLFHSFCFSFSLFSSYSSTWPATHVSCELLITERLNFVSV